MKNDLKKFSIPNGLEIDIDEGWKKLISRQFGGEAGRSFLELIQNFIDSYDDDVPWEKRVGEIDTTENSISLTDYGAGMNYEKLTLLTTLGGTDKDGNPNKIGKFGIGFFSIFNPRLSTKRVLVTTRCEGYSVQLIFEVTDPEKRPSVTARTLNQKISFSTKITIEFQNSYSVKNCLNSALKSLKFYPCRIKLNGIEFNSLWEEARQKKVIEFRKNSCHGLIERSSLYYNTIVLCKYFHIMDMSFPTFLAGGYNMTYDLDDYEKVKAPYLRNIKLVINCNALNLTISRDSYYLDYNNTIMLRTVCKELSNVLQEDIKDADNQLILANQYIFRNKIKSFLQGEDFDDKEEYLLMKKLSEKRIYQVKGNKSNWSLLDMHRNLNRNIPLFYAKDPANTRWLAGNFTHDFIVITEDCVECNGAKSFYKKLFGSIFEDVVNLDTIRENPEKISDLIQRGIIDKSALAPECEFIRELELNLQERSFLKELETLLNNAEIRKVISLHFKLDIKKIVPIFFKMKDDGCFISAGIFEKSGRPVSDDFMEQSNSNMWPFFNRNNFFLGICLDNPVIRYLILTQDHHRVYFILSFIAHELLSCQKQLVPDCSFTNYRKERLSADLRKALINDLLSRDLINLNVN
jgi:hypothetical protein